MAQDSRVPGGHETDHIPACSWADIDVRYDYFEYYGNTLFSFIEKKELAEGAQRIKAGFDQEARSGAFNHSYILLDAQLRAFIDSWTHTLEWHKKRESERREAHARYLEFQAHKQQQEQEMVAERAAADEQQRRRDKQRLTYEQVRVEARLRTLLNLARDVTGSSRLSSMTSHYNLK